MVYHLFFISFSRLREPSTRTNEGRAPTRTNRELRLGADGQITWERSHRQREIKKKKKKKRPFPSMQIGQRLSCSSSNKKRVTTSLTRFVCFVFRVWKWEKTVDQHPALRRQNGHQLFFVFLIRLPPRDVLDYFLLWIERSWESENLLRLKSNKNLKGSRRKREELVLFFSYFAVSPFLLEYSFSFNLQLVSIVQLTRIIVPPKTQNLACYDWGKKKKGKGYHSL